MSNIGKQIDIIELQFTNIKNYFGSDKFLENSGESVSLLKNVLENAEKEFNECVNLLRIDILDSNE